MTAEIDITGKRFGKLEAFFKDVPRNGHSYWVFLCDCGKFKNIRKSHVSSRRVVSCGCVPSGTKHGMVRSRVWRVWKSMRQRCSNPRTMHYHRYGGRGITVCQEWSTFEQFHMWAINNGYSDHLEIDRIDNDGNYCPSNCQFITHSENSRKKGNTVMIEIDGVVKSMVDWAEAANLEYGTVKARMARGWPPEKIFQPRKIVRKRT